MIKYPDHLRADERLPIEGLLTAAIDLGFYVAVFCEDDERLVAPTRRLDLIRPEIAATSITNLRFYNPGATDGVLGKRAGWVMLVHGNGEDVVSDYTANEVTEAIVVKGEQVAAALARREAAIGACAQELLDALKQAEPCVAQLCEGQDPGNACWDVLKQVREAIKSAES